MIKHEAVRIALTRGRPAHRRMIGGILNGVMPAPLWV